MYRAPPRWEGVGPEPAARRICVRPEPECSDTQMYRAPPGTPIVTPGPGRQTSPPGRADCYFGAHEADKGPAFSFLGVWEKIPKGVHRRNLEVMGRAAVAVQSRLKDRSAISSVFRKLGFASGLHLEICFRLCSGSSVEYLVKHSDCLRCSNQLPK